MQVEPKTRAVAQPPIGEASQAFIGAARAGRIVLPWCERCGRFGHPGNDVCPECWEADMRWRRASGRGDLFSFVVFRRSFHPEFAAPYNVAVVELEEGPRLVGRVVGVPLEHLYVGMSLVAGFPRDAKAPIEFRPAQPRRVRTDSKRGDA